MLDRVAVEKLSPKEAAALIGVHATTVQRWCVRGIIRAVRVGRGRWMIDRDTFMRQVGLAKHSQHT